jgi:ABC-type glutathione transport system ATPase component
MDKLDSGVSTGPNATGGTDGVEPAVPLLQMRGITKSFFGVPVLDVVDLDVIAGEVHAVVGENGAGKSTLMKILVGAYQPDAGSILLDGEEVRFGHPRQAQERGVSIIYQEFNLLPERTVAQNIFLGREPARGPLVDNRAMEEATARLLTQLGVEGAISPRSRCASCLSLSSKRSRSRRRSHSRPESWSWMNRLQRFLRTRSTLSSSGCGSCRSGVSPSFTSRTG